MSMHLSRAVASRGLPMLRQRASAKFTQSMPSRGFASGHAEEGARIVSTPWPSYVVYPVAAFGVFGYISAVIKRNNSKMAAPEYKVVLDEEVAQGLRTCDYSLKH